VVAGEARPARERAAVRIGTVQRVDHEVDEVAQSVGHGLIVFDMVLDAAPDPRHGARMPSWSDFAEEAPELAERVRERFEAHRHKTIATLRRDGSPRISGTEAQLADGELWIGSMWQALKARDLQRDPRFALHSGSDEPTEWRGDAKVAGVVEEITDEELVRKMNGEATSGPSHLFRLDLHEASVVGLNGARDAIVIEMWRPGQGVRRRERG
jgi:hypothetical protein